MPNDEFCIKNDEFCIKNDEICSTGRFARRHGTTTRGFVSIIGSSRRSVPTIYARTDSNMRIVMASVNETGERSINRRHVYTM